VELLFFLGFSLSCKPKKAVATYPISEVVGPPFTLLALFLLIVWEGGIEKHVAQMSLFFSHLLSPSPSPWGRGCRASSFKHLSLQNKLP